MPRQILVTVSHMGLVCVCVLSLTDSLAPPAVSPFNGLTVRNCDGNLNDAPAVRYIMAGCNQKQNWISEVYSHKKTKPADTDLSSSHRTACFNSNFKGDNKDFLNNSYNVSTHW